MITLALKLDTRRKNKNGTYPIVFAVTNKRQTTTIPTGITIFKSDYNGDERKMIHNTVDNANELNANLYEKYLEMQQLISQLERTAKDTQMSAVEVKKYLLTAEIENENTNSFSEYARRHAEKYSGTTRRTYDYTIRLVENHFKNNVVFFKDITVGVLRDLDDEWSKTMGLSARSINFRNIRTIFNRAIDDEITDNYPFRKFKIKNGHKEKDFLPVSCMKKLQELHFSKNEHLIEMTRDLFLLSFYLCGVNLNDIFSWKKDVVKKGKIVFVRKKIAVHEPDEIKITIQPEALSIIKKYQGTEFLINAAENYNNNYDNFYGYIKHRIGKIGEMVNFPKLTFYYARYSWASYADKIGIDEKVISKSLGHTDQSIAGRHYISYDWARTDEANRKVIDYVQGKVEKNA